MKNIVIILIAGILLFSGYSVQATANEFARAITSFYTGEYELAQQQIKELLDSNLTASEKYTAYSYLVKTELKLRNITEAQRLMDEFLSNEYGNPELFWLIAEQYLNLDGYYDNAQYKDAKHYIKKAREAGYFSSAQKFGLAQAELGLENYARAVELLEPLKDEFESPMEYEALARAYKETDDLKSAVNLYERVIVMEPGNAGSHLSLGNIYLQLGSPTEAIAVLEQGLTSSPEKISLKFTLARAYYENNDFEKARPRFNEVIRNNPHNYEAHYYLALTNLEQGQVESATESLEMAIHYNPKYVSAYLEMGKIYLTQNNPYKAISYFGEAIEINEDYALSYYQLGKAYYKLEQYEAAKSELESAINRDPKLKKAAELLELIDENLSDQNIDNGNEDGRQDEQNEQDNDGADVEID